MAWEIRHESLMISQECLHSELFPEVKVAQEAAYYSQELIMILLCNGVNIGARNCIPGVVNNLISIITVNWHFPWKLKIVFFF